MFVMSIQSFIVVIMTNLSYNDEMSVLDSLDQKLVQALRGNARLPVSALASMLGVARTTIQARIERLERRGVITGYTVKVNPDVNKAHIRATVLVQVAPRATPELLARLETLPQVELAHTTSGRFDLTVQLRADTTADLDLTLDKIGEMEGIRSLESLIHLSTRIDRAF